MCIHTERGVTESEYRAACHLVDNESMMMRVRKWPPRDVEDNAPLEVRALAGVFAFLDQFENAYGENPYAEDLSCAFRIMREKHQALYDVAFGIAKGKRFHVHPDGSTDFKQDCQTCRLIKAVNDLSAQGMIYSDEEVPF